MTTREHPKWINIEDSWETKDRSLATRRDKYALRESVENSNSYWVASRRVCGFQHSRYFSCKILEIASWQRKKKRLEK